MKNQEFSWGLFNKVPLVGIIRGLSRHQISQVLPLFAESGLTTVEITLNTDDAPKNIEDAVLNFGTTLNIGAGTICGMDDLELALNSGAQFIVTPVLEEEVVRSCVARGVPVFPGAFTPTEIFRAWKLGAPLVKVYPATAVGPQFIRDVKAPLNHVRLLPTGGINLSNIEQFIRAGSDGVGVGGHLFDPQFIAREDWPGLKAHFARFAEFFAANI